MTSTKYAPFTLKTPSGPVRVLRSRLPQGIQPPGPTLEEISTNPALYRRAEEILTLLPAPTREAPIRALDLGSGRGIWSRILPRHWILEDHEAARGAAIPSSLRCITPASRVLVTAWFFLEHLPTEADLLKTLSEVSRILALGGLFAVSVPSQGGAFARFCPSAASDADDPSHVWGFTPRSLSRLLRAFGFKVERIRVTGLHPERVGLPRKPWILKLWKILRLGDTFEIYARLQERKST